jgi:3-phenylpropionate/cinnamic acid dioxygenase small subunit
MSTSRDVSAINALMCEYCDSVDRGDLDGFSALFAEGAWGIAGDLAEGAGAVRAVLDNVILYDGKPNTRHLMSNQRISIDDSGDRATAVSCITVMQCVPGDFSLQAIFVGTYHDTFHRRDGQWRFTKREIVPDLVGDMSRHRSDMA